MLKSEKFLIEDLLRIVSGVDEFNRGHYWQCHEEIEDIWLEYSGDDIRFVYWSIIQLATCLYHWEDGNLNGAVGMIKKMKRKLVECEVRHVEGQVVKEFLNWTQLKAIVESIPTEAKLEDFIELSKFKFPLTTTWPKEG